MPEQALQPQPLDTPYESFEARKESRKSLLGFSLVYLSGYFYDPPATFHGEMVHALEDENIRRLLLIGFRGCGKTKFGSLALPLFAALEYPEKYPFIILVANTSQQGSLNLFAIKNELETNALIKQDYGEIKGTVIEDFSLRGEGDEWQKQNIVLSNGVRILARARSQKIRGITHLQHRPRLIVVDDPEDGEWVRTKENRDKTDRWLHSEIMPGMDARKGKLVVIGNLLHMDALLSRLRAPGTGFKSLEFPLIDKDGKCTWPAMYPTDQSLKDKERDMGAIAWQREMLLKIVAEDEAVIRPEDIHYYDERPKNSVASIKGHGIDLAISEKEGADYTSIVSGEVFYVDDAPKIFIRPNPYNRHVTFHEFLKHVRGIPGEMKGANLFFVEDVAYQKAAIQEMERALLPVVPMKPQGDKRARLQVVAPYIKNGTVLFPRSGCEELLGQMFNLGVESHDDLCLAGDTQVLTERGNVPICHVQVGDRVMTRRGYKRVLWAGMTGIRPVITRFGLTGTSNHPVIAARGVIHLCNIHASDIVYIWNQSRSCTETKSIGAIQTQSNEPTASITGAMTNIASRLIRFIATCGSMLTDPFRAVYTSIIKTAILSTISLPTLSLNAPGSICPITCDNPTVESNPAGRCSNTSFRPPVLGTHLRSESHGTNNMHKHSGSIQFVTCGLARNVKSRLRHFIRTRGDAATDVTRDISAEPIQPTIPKGEKRPVYNLLVEDAHEFFANGVLVHNCDAAVYLIQGLANQGLELPKIQWIEA